MVQAPKCRFCGEAHFSTQPCSALSASKPKIVEAMRKVVAKPVAITAKLRKPWKATDGTGTLVGVRLQGDLLHRLNKARGAATRPQFIRAILDRELAK